MSSDGTVFSSFGNNLRVGGSLFEVINGSAFTGSNVLTVMNTGNVGIGTTSPTTKLEVIGKFHVGTGNNWFRVEGPNPGTASPLLASWGGAGDFQIDAPGVFGGRFVVKDSSGNVGIGTPTPSQKLDVNGNVTLSGKLMGASGVSTPIAYAHINANGTVVTGTSNVSSIFNATSNWYEITITGVNYFFSSFVTIASPSPPSNTVVIPSVGSVSGKLIIQ